MTNSQRAHARFRCTVSTFPLLTLLFALLIGVSAQSATIIYVNKNVGSTSTQSGTTWANAYRELRDALTNPAVTSATQANPVELWVATGTYLPAAAGSTDRTKAFTLQNHIRILGGFAGTETSDTQRLFFGHATVLSGDIGLVQANAITDQNAESINAPVNPADPNLQDNCYNVVRGIGVTDVVLDKLVIANGAAISNGYSGIQIDGMATVNSDTSVEVTGTTVNALDPVVAGAGLYFEYSHSRSTNVNLVINNCTFLNNAAMGYGGGVAVKEAHVEVVYTTFQGNSAGEEGGAFFGQNNNFDFAYCTFTDNYSDGSGGALGIETISSDATMPPFNDPKAFEQALGVNQKDFRSYVGYGLSASTAIPKMYRSFSAAYNTSKGFWKILGRGFRSSLPQNPASSTEALGNGLKAEAGIGSRVAGAYAYLSIAISVTDLGVDIADAYGGVDENNPDYKRWKIFSEGFNQYATPQGWVTMLVGVIINAVGNDAAAALRDNEEALKRFQLYAYNQAGYSTVAYCTFQNNFAIEDGGAVQLGHDNVQFESCKFSGNTGVEDGGAMALTAWTTPKVFNCSFYQNSSSNGNSAIVSYEHARSQIIGCTFYKNYSTSTNGYAVACLHGSEVTLFNSILWGNTNSLAINSLGGADVYAEKQADLVGDTNLVQALNDAGAAIGDWVGICDIANCDIQSLNRIAVGHDDIPLFQHRSYTDDEANAVLKARQDGEDSGPLISYGFVNLGEGIRPTLLDSAHGNISVDPQLNESTLLPSIGNSVIDAGSKKRFNNGNNDSITGVDVLLQDRLVGASYDMGAVERQEGFAAGDTVYVRPTPTGNGSGSSWANATSNLQAAINGSYNHQVWVAAGTYYPSTTGNRGAAFSLVSGVAVYGGFAGNETVLSQRNWNVNQTILSGDIGVHGNDSDNSYVIIYNTNVDSRALLDGFTLTKGRNTGYGGAIYNNNAYPTIRNCKFIDNQAASGGAVGSTGIEGSEFYNCQFIGNSAQGGGALYFQSRLRTEGCIFQNNTANVGGAIQLDSSDYAYLFNTLFVSNSISGSTAYGGAIYDYESDLRMYNCTFYRNSAVLNNNYVRGGGAIEQLAHHTSFSAQNCIFWNNTATNTGGATASIEHQQIVANSPLSNTIRNTIVDGLSDFAGSTFDANLDTDPLFVNAAAGNFQLTASSAAIDAARDFIGYGFPTNDLAGNPRVTGDATDIGAYEFQGTANKITLTPVVVKTCDDSGGVYSLQVIATNLPVGSYQWEVNKGDGTGYTAVPNAAPYQGATSTNLAVVHPSLSLNGYRFRLRITGSSTFVSSAATLRVSPPVLYVKSTAFGAGTGLSWADAFTDLQLAINAAAPCSQIWVAAGTYYPGTTTNATIRMKSGIAIYGGFVGVESSLAQRNFSVNKTILSGNIGNSRYSQNIIWNFGNQIGYGCDSTALLDGFTLTSAGGSAMLNDYATPTIRNCTFTGNNGVNGAAMYNRSQASPIVTACVFTANTAAGDGGAVRNDSGSNPTFINCIFNGNHCHYRGGGMANFLANPQVLSCTFFNNAADRDGGGLYQQGGSDTVRNSIFWHNQSGSVNTAISAQQVLQEYSGQLLISSCCVQGATDSNLPYDPLFVDTGSANFRLSPFSPLINAGSNTYTNGINTDFDGSPRVVGGVIDIGAFELQTSPSNSITLLAAPQSVTTCDVGLTQKFSITGTNGSSATYQWQVNTGSGYVNVSGGNYSVATSNATSTLTVTAITSSMNGYQYRVLINGTIATPPATLTISSPTIIYVNVNQSSGLHNGTSWFNAYNDLKAAINSADTCDEIWVARGTYKPTTNYDNQASFAMKSGLGIYGGFVGNESTRSQRNPTNNVTILAAATNSSSIIFNNGYTVAIDSSAAIDGFTLTGATNFSAINNFYASPTIRNCTFTGNAHSVFNHNSPVTISSCLFSNNTDASVYNNYASNTKISNCQFIGNQTDQSGAGVYNNGSAVSIDACVFQQNTGGWGGGIFNDRDANVLVTRCSFFNNSSSSGGGGLYNGVGASSTVANSLFANNTTPRFRGGAIANYGASLTLLNCTIVNNTAAVSGGGIYNQATGLQITNSILWGNVLLYANSATDAATAQIDDAASYAKTGYLIVQNLGTLSSGNLNYDPLFNDPTTGDYRLSGYSPAVDAGNSAASQSLSNSVATVLDLDGNARIFGASADIGAYERQSAATGIIRLLASPQSVTVCVGNSAAFSVVGLVTTNYTYQWQQQVGGNFVALGTGNFSISNSANSSTLLFTNVSLANAGTYRVAITGTAYASAPVTLNVNPPHIIYVDARSTNTVTGLTWTNAYRTLQDALAVADACSQVWVAKGVYVMTNSANHGISLAMKQGLRIYGGFSGNETSVLQRSPANTTVLQSVTTLPIFANYGNLGTVDASSVLDGFTLTGFADSAILNYTASPTIQNCVFSNNFLAIENTQQGNPIILNCLFTNNTAAAISSTPDCDMYVSNSVFAGNSSTFRGGAIFHGTGSLQLIDCRFTNNTSSSMAGAVCAEETDPVVMTRCIFSGNNASDGGAVTTMSANGIADDCLFVNNTAGYRGGAINTLGGGFVLRNCTVAANSAVSQYGGGICQNSGTIAATNTIFWLNTSGELFATRETQQIGNVAGGSKTFANCCIQGLTQYAGNGNIGYDPLFRNVSSADYSLLPNSPAINTGNNSAATSSATDVAGHARIFSTTVDMGALEATIIGTAVQWTLAPVSQHVCVGNSTNFTVQSASNLPVDFAWQVNAGPAWGSIPNDGHQFVSTSGSNSVLTISNAVLTMNAYQYRAIVPSMSFTSAVVTLTVSPRNIIYVNAANNSGNQAGTNWASAFNDLQNALAAADECSEVWVAAGTYRTRDYYGLNAFQLPVGVQIYGGFAGTETLRTQRNLTNNISTLKTGPGVTTYGAIVYNFGYRAPYDRNTIIDGLTFTSTNSEAAIYNDQASPTIRNCRFIQNQGRAIENVVGAPLIDTCTFTSNNNTTVHVGYGSTVTITNCLFTTNSTVGGNLLIDIGATAFISGCTFSNNYDAYQGAGIACNDPNSTCFVTNCVFTDNRSGSGAPALHVQSANASVVQCLFARNRSDNYPGAVYSGLSAFKMINCTVVSNYARHQGGMYLTGGNPSIVNSILWGNTDSDLGASGSSPQLYLNGNAPTTSLTNCCVQGLVNTNNGSISFNPLLANIAAGNYTLQDRSPCANTGNNSYIAGVSTDLAGNTRIQNTTVDMGAYESPYFLPPIQIISDPKSQTHCPGEIAPFTASINNATNGVVWYYDTGAGFTSFGSSAGNQYFGPPLGTYYVTSSGNTYTLTVSNTVPAMSGYRFKYSVSAFSYFSDPATLTVNSSLPVYVNASAAPGGDGNSWATAFQDLQQALPLLSTCRPQVWVAKGTYYPSVSDTNKAFAITSEFAVYGGFAGNETLLSQRNINANPTILSGAIGNGNANANSRFVVTFGGGSAATRLDGFIVEQASVNGVILGSTGGTLANCIIRSNYNGGVGIGGAGTPIITNCSIIWNRGNNGGGISGFTATTRVQNCLIEGNYSTNGGGGIYFQGGTPSVANTLIAGNKALFGGGGVQYASSPGGINMTNCTIVDNVTSFSSGGGYYGGPVLAHLENCILWNNKSTGNSVVQSQFDFSFGGSSNIYYCDIQQATLGMQSGYSFSVDPVFGAPPSMTAPYVGGDYHLQACSPAANAGDPFYNSGFNPGSIYDLDGNSRNVGTIDVGCYELQSAASTQLKINSGPNSIPYCSSSPTVMSVDASGAGLTYQWQGNFNDGKGFTILSDNALFVGTTTPALTITNANSAFDQTQYRCIVNSSSGCNLASPIATLTLRPTRLYVNASAPSGGNGLSWATAYNKLENAIYSPALDTCGSEIWVAAGRYVVAPQANGYYWPLTNHVALYGGFNGTETALYQRNWKTNLTTLTGNTGSGSSQYIFYTYPNGSVVDNSARVDGFTLQEAAYGIYNEQGYQVPGASPTIVNCVFKGLLTAIYNGSYPDYGNSSPVIQDCVFLNNGPGLAPGGQSGPSCINNSYANTTIQRCEFRGNQAYGLITAGNGTVKIYNCLFSGNAPGQNTCIAGYNGSTLDVRNTTIAYNKSFYSPCGIYIANAGEVDNCILWGNETYFSGPNAGTAFQFGGSAVMRNTTVQGGDTANGDLNSDPHFIQSIAVSNSGTTNGDYHVSACLSPTINAGNNAFLAGDLFDLEGNPRVNQSIVDMGAYENSMPTLSLGAVSDQSAYNDGIVQFSVSANRTNTTYQWQVNTGSGFVNASSPYTGVTTSILSFSNPTYSMNGYQFRCAVQTTDGCSQTSTAGTFHYLAGHGAPIVSGPNNFTCPDSLSPGQVFGYYSATSPDNLSYTWSVGGTDGSNFQITSGGGLSFRIQPDALNPADANGDNIYDISIIATDSLGHSGSLSLPVTVNYNPNKVVFTSTPVTNATVGQTWIYKFNAVGPASPENIQYFGNWYEAWMNVRSYIYDATTLAGNGNGSDADGTSTNASFQFPTGGVLDASSNLLVANFTTLRKITTNGVVTTLPAYPGYARDLVKDAAGNIYIADFGYQTIRQLSADRTTANILTSAPHIQHLAVDAAGTNFYFTTTGHAIYRYQLGGSTIDFVGTDNGYGLQDGNGTSAKFFSPQGMCVGPDGNLYVADWGNAAIRKVTPNGDVTTVIRAFDPNFMTPDNDSYQFTPTCIALDAVGNMYTADQFDGRVRKITTNLYVSTIAGTDGTGFADGAGPLAQFSDHSFGITVTPDGSTAYVFDTDNYRVRKLTRYGGMIWGTPSASDLGTNFVELAAKVVETGIQDFNVIVGNANTPPTANDQAIQLYLNTTTNITLTATDLESDPLTYTVAQSPTNGILTGTAPNLTYQPNANYFGPDAFTFIANDGHSDSGPATVSITVVYRAPLTLTVIKNGTTQVDLAWPSGYPSAILESTAALGPSAVWSTIPTTGTGATVPISTARQYFRLRVP